MKFKVEEIVKAWVIAYNPNKQETKLALERGFICKSCEHRIFRSLLPICGACGCPISKKIFSPNFNACPKNKWESVDKNSYINLI